jgi:hypothetical protein
LVQSIKGDQLSLVDLIGTLIDQVMAELVSRVKAVSHTDDEWHELEEWQKKRDQHVESGIGHLHRQGDKSQNEAQNENHI